MHRAISRAFRGTCRKLRENPSDSNSTLAAGEEASHQRKSEDHRNTNTNTNGFCPRKHSWEEAVTWTTGLVLGYQLTHGSRHRRLGVQEQGPINLDLQPQESESGSGLRSKSPIPEKLQNPCPFNLSKALTQPGTGTDLKLGLKASGVRRNRTRTLSSSSTGIPSIDVTPFIEDIQDNDNLPEKYTSNNVTDEDIVFTLDIPDDPNDPKRKPSVLERIQGDPVGYGTKYGADLLSVLGAFDYLQGTDGKSKDKSHGMQLMRRGAELGSSRALYNLGVAYEREDNLKLAKEYYKKAAENGHPLGMFNSAVFALKEGRLSEGYAMMNVAKEMGVPEAEKFMKPASSPQKQGRNVSVTSFQIGHV